MKYVKLLFILCFVCSISVIGLTTIYNKNEQSMMEGRQLRQLPDLDFKRFTENYYLTAITNAFADQITFREQMIVLYNQWMVNVLKQKWVGSVAIGKETQMFEQPEVVTDMEAYEQEVIKCAKFVNREAKKVREEGSVFIYINYPRKDVVETKYLPDFYPSTDKDYEHLLEVMKSHLSEDVVFVDACEILKKVDKAYYSVDHHVNFDGQLLIYQELMDMVKERFPDAKVWQKSDFTLRETEMAGSYNRRIAYVVPVEKEPLWVKPKTKISYKRKGDGKGLPLYGQEGNSYGFAFMGADFASSLVITKEEKKRNSSSLPTIFITGSSYTNSLEALCVGSFSSMHSVDFRHNTSGKTVADYAKEEKPDYVVYIPNQSDRNFSLDAFKIHLGLK